MTAALVALAVAALGFAGTTVALALQLGKARAAEAKLAARVESLLGNLDVLRQRVEAEVAAHADSRARYERVIGDMKNEIHAMEKDLDACTDPAAVRDRLRRVLLGGSAAGPGPAADPAPGLPAATITGMDLGPGGIRGRR